MEGVGMEMCGVWMGIGLTQRARRAGRSESDGEGVSLGVEMSILARFHLRCDGGEETSANEFGCMRAFDPFRNPSAHAEGYGGLVGLQDLSGTGDLASFA